MVTANERREEIMRIMVSRRQENIDNLACEFGVHRRTIERDIELLSTQYPLYTSQGNGGGVRLLESYHPYRNSFSRRDVEVLQNLMGKASDEERQVIENLIREHSRYDLDLLK